MSPLTQETDAGAFIKDFRDEYPLYVEEIFLQAFLEILKRMLQIFLKNLKKYFLVSVEVHE